MNKRPPAIQDRKNIVFDAHALIGQKTGIGYYTYDLIMSLATAYPNIQFTGYYHNFLGRKKITGLPQADNITYRPIVHIPGQVVNALNRAGLYIPLEFLIFKRSDFVLYPNFWGQPPLGRTQFANIVHDLSYYDVPEFVSTKNAQDLLRMVPYELKKAAFVITVSHFSAQRIHELYDYPLSNIVVTHIPASKPLSVSSDVTKTTLGKLNLSPGYLLFMGTLEPRKNILTLLSAYSLLPKDFRDKHPLVLAGKLDWKFEEIVTKINELKDSGVTIHQLGYVSDLERAVLYQNAACYVQCSTYEGFGMPILEALSYGTTVCASDIPVFKEVAGDTIDYFDPLDPSSIADCIQRSASSDSKRPLFPLTATWKKNAEAVMSKILSNK